MSKRYTLVGAFGPQSQHKVQERFEPVITDEIVLDCESNETFAYSGAIGGLLPGILLIVCKM